MDEQIIIINYRGHIPNGTEISGFEIILISCLGWLLSDFFVSFLLFVLFTDYGECASVRQVGGTWDMFIPVRQELLPLH